MLYRLGFISRRFADTVTKVVVFLNQIRVLTGKGIRRYRVLTSVKAKSSVSYKTFADDTPT